MHQFVRTVGFSTVSISVIYLMPCMCHSIKSMARMCKTWLLGRWWENSTYC